MIAAVTQRRICAARSATGGGMLEGARQDGRVSGAHLACIHHGTPL